MKTKQIRNLMLLVSVLVCWILPSKSWASVEVDGIYYDLDTTNKTAAVASNPDSYSGAINIPANVVYNGNTYIVTKIGENVFAECKGLTSITIPNSVSEIGGCAFELCTNLTSIEIPNSVTSIGFWTFSYCSSLSSVTIPNSVTSIGERAFFKCSGLTSVTVPDNVTSIGVWAFCGCSSLSSVTIPNSVTSIGGGAFKDCTSLTSVTIPSSVTSICAGSFQGCTSLTSAIIPNSVTSICAGAFSSCINLTSVTIPNSVTSIGNQAFNNCTSLTTLTIPNSVTSIGSEAFQGCSLTSATIPNSVTSIGDGAFSNCSLTSVTIPNSVTSIGESAFGGCWCLTSITCENKIPVDITSSVFQNVNKSSSTLYVPKGSKSAYENAEYWSEFENIVELDAESDEDILATGQCGDNVTYTIYSDYSMVISGTGAMWDYDYSCITPDYKDFVQELTIEEGVTTIGRFAFAQFTGITSLTIPNSVTNIGKYSFGDCTSLASIDFGSGVLSIGNYAFIGCSSLVSLAIPDNVTSIDDNAFSACSNVTSLTIGSGLQGLGTAPFPGNISSVTIDERNENLDSRDNCNGIIRTSTNELIFGCKNTKIPNSVTSIGDRAFDGCEGLASLVIPNSVTSFGYMAFSNCDITAIVLPNSVTSTGYNAFYGCSNLKTIVAESVTPIPYLEFEHADKSSCTLYVPQGTKSAYESAEHWNEFENIVEIGVSDDKNVLAIGYCGDNLTYIVFSDMSMEIMGTGEMWSNNREDYSESFWDEHVYSVEKIIIDDGVTSIGDLVFESLWSLTSVTMPNSLITIGASAFCYCGNLTSITIPQSVKEIGYDSFSGCNLSSITVEPGNPVYDSRNNCNAIIETSNNCLIIGCKTTIIPQSVTTIGDFAFWHTELTSITIPSSVTSMGNPFAYCDRLTSMVVDPDNPVYDSRANCNAIIETSTGCLISGCKSTIIPDGVTSIGNEAFYGCKNLSSIIIPNTVISIGDEAFSDCPKLSSLTIPNSVISIGSRAFDGTPWYWNQPDGLVYAGRVLYRYKGNIAEGSVIEIADGTLGIAGSAFYAKPTNFSVIIPNGVTNIGSSAFSLCSGLTNVNIPNSVTSIGISTFGRCRSLTSITLSNNLESIGRFAFEGCTGLTTVTIPNSVTDIEGGAFYNCLGLTSIKMENIMPINIISNVFSYVNKSTCTLYVPKGSKSAYENAEYWNDFENIVEYDPNPDTDISALANAIYVEQVEGRIGGTKDISIRMKNSYPIRGFQFKLELPEGTTINGWSLSTDRLPSGATTSDKVGTQRIDGNKINVACSLNYGNATFTGSDGEIATVNVTFGEDMEVGSYAIYLTECDVNDAAGTDEGLSDIKSTLILEDYVPGDANGDGLVRIGDTTTILNYIVGNASQNFQVKAADVNGDGLVRIGDVTAVLNIIVSQ